MTWQRSKARLHLTIAGCLAIFLSGCATNDIGNAARRQADASQVGAALEAADAVPPLPGDCRQVERSGVKVGDRLDTALAKADAALGRANARVRRCAAWFDGIRGGQGDGE